MTSALVRFSIASVALVAAPAPAGVDLALETVATLDQPMLVTAPSGDDRLFVAEREGAIRILVDGAPLPDPFLDISDVVYPFGESGLLGLAFHPDYEDNGWFFVHYNTWPDENNRVDTVIERYTVLDDDPDRADASSAMTILRMLQPFGNHNAGSMSFGPDDGWLYFPLGDGGGDGRPRSQDITDDLFGAILRLDVNGDDALPEDPDRNYAIPSDNPFVGIEGDDEIFAFGLRNPYRSAMDRATGDLWLADVGAGSWEEINVLPAGTAGGQNFGWGCMEGPDCNGNWCVCNDPGLTLPVHAYDRDAGRTVTGVAIYRGCAIPGLDGVVIFADFFTDRIWSFRYDGEEVTEFTERTAEIGGTKRIAAIGEDARGELYICSLDGDVLRIVAAETPKEDPCALVGDLDGDGAVDFADLLILLSGWGPCEDCPEDLDGDGEVGFGDLLLLLANWTA